MDFLNHAILDSIKIIPLVFLIYAFIEYIEHKNNTFFSHTLMKSKKGVIFGALLGSIPQCGFSVVAADLFSKKAITMGTLIAIFVATSDEAIPIILSHPEKTHISGLIILIKIVLAVLFGLIIDFLYKKPLLSVCKIENHHEHFHSNCEPCDDGILRSAIRHTIKIFLFVLIVNIFFELFIHKMGDAEFGTFMLKNTFAQPFVASLLGLVPNCAISVLLTQGYLSGAISFGSLVAGLTSGAGVGALYLLKRNKNAKENVIIITTLYLIGAFSGILLDIFIK